MLDCPTCGIRHYAPATYGVHFECAACGNLLVANPGWSHDTVGPEPVPGGRQFLLAREVVATYVRWREACEEVRAAYQHWGYSESPPEVALAFAAYRAALDREEQAARVYSDAADQFRAESR